MNKYLYRFTQISVDHRLELFDKLITPILNYGSEIWGFQKGDVIERLHMKFCKTILGVKKSTQNDFIYGELGRRTMLCNRQICIIKYWFKILSSNENKYVRKVYKMMLNDININPNKVNWASLLRDTLCNMGFQDVWLAQSVGNEKIFFKIFEQRVSDNFIQTWESRLNESSRALFYNTIRNFSLQPYLKICSITKNRFSLTRFRLSSHRLEVEAGRWNKPIQTPLMERKCRICNILEDEFHFLFVCPLYADLRKQYLKKYFYCRPNMFKLVLLLNTTSTKVMRDLATFVHKAFNIRNSFIFN